MTSLLLFRASAILAAGLACFSSANGADGLTLSLSVKPGEGERFLSADFSCWIPDAAAAVKAVIVHQHGCTNASPDKHPPITGDWHWRSLARKHQAALIVPMYQVAGRCDEWNDPESGSERALLTALEDFAKRSGRAELVSAPWVLWGHSGGSSWSAQMILRHPGRVLAASFRGGCHRQFGDPAFRERFAPIARDLPLLFVWGKRETVPSSSHFVSWDPMNRMFDELRSTGAKTCRVIDPRSEHGCDDSRLMSLSFFDAVLSKGSPPGALADIVSLESREWNDANRIDPSLVWLPNEDFAKRWREFSGTGTLRPVRPALAAPDLKAVADERGRIVLTWRIVPEIAGGLRALRIRRDGELWREIGIGADAPLATARDSTPEALRIESVIDASSAAHTYALTYLDAAGNESPPGEARTPAR